jgi:hypothetical protein
MRESDFFVRRWRIPGTRLQFELNRHIHYYPRGDRRFVYRLHLVYDTKVPAA